MRCDPVMRCDPAMRRGAASVRGNKAYITRERRVTSLPCQHLGVAAAPTAHPQHQHLSASLVRGYVRKIGGVEREYPARCRYEKLGAHQRLTLAPFFITLLRGGGSLSPHARVPPCPRPCPRRRSRRIRLSAHSISLRRRRRRRRSGLQNP